MHAEVVTAGEAEVVCANFEFRHQVIVDSESARGVIDDRGKAFALGAGEASGADRGWQFALRAGMDWNINRGSEGLQLIDGGGAIDIGGDQQRLFAQLGQMDQADRTPRGSRNGLRGLARGP